MQGPNYAADAKSLYDVSALIIGEWLGDHATIRFRRGADVPGNRAYFGGPGNRVDITRL